MVGELQRFENLRFSGLPVAEIELDSSRTEKPVCAISIQSKDCGSLFRLLKLFERVLQVAEFVIAPAQIAECLCRSCARPKRFRRREGGFVPIDGLVVAFKPSRGVTQTSGRVGLKKREAEFARFLKSDFVRLHRIFVISLVDLYRTTREVEVSQDFGMRGQGKPFGKSQVFCGLFKTTRMALC